jgi:hypothetical protein
MLHLLELILYSFTSATLILEGFKNPANLIWFTIVLAALYLWLRRRRKREWGSRPLAFAEGDIPAVEPLSLTAE